MSNLSMDYRLSLYTELVELRKDKIYIVQSSLDEKLYIKKFMYPDNYDIFIKIKEISSPHIPKIYEVISFQDKLIVIEEYINGFTLEEILRNQKTLPEYTALKYSIDLCQILDILHNCSPPIIHRDIKPSNIIISNDNVLKLIDYDVSRTQKVNTYADTDILGTHGYAAPEQFGFSQSDSRTDIYSLGITMNVMLTGSISVNNYLDNNLSKIVTKCTKLDSNNRFQNVKELEYALLEKSSTYKIQNDTPSFIDRRLPGFRSAKISHKILGYLWYCLLILTSLGFFTNDLTLENRRTDIIITSFLFVITLLIGNYKNLKTKLPLLSSNRRFVRFIGYLVYSLLILIISGSFLPD